MKPTEVNANNQNMDKNSGSPNQSSPNNMHMPRPGGSRRFSPFASETFGNMEADIPDMFGDTDLREHIRAMRNPFDGWPMRKRSSSMNNNTPQQPQSQEKATPQHQQQPHPGHANHQQHPHQPEPDVYQHVYDDPEFMSHFSPHWDSVGRLGRKRAQQPGIFNNPEIFEHIPEFFDMFPSRRPSNIRTQEPFRGVPHANAPEPVVVQHEQQQQNSAPPAAPPSRPKYCDAAMQTDDSVSTPESSSPQKSTLNQHGLRNTVDMGQRSPSEQTRTERAQSAPPPTESPVNGQSIPHNSMPQQSFASASASSSASAGGPNQSFATTYAQGPNAYTYANAEPKHNQQAHSSTTTGTQPSSNPQTTSQGSQSSFQPQQQQSPSNASGMGTNNVRSVPIFVEGRNEFINTPTPDGNHSAQFAFNTTAQTNQKPQKPTVQTNNVDNTSNQPPQTPHTVDSINKIQAIQRDVLCLMHQVEKFAYTKQDKEYIYLDEMLTRNLLKLDTIDTNGKDSIRMARKEAIKCIQSSLNVLEAKAEINAKAKEEMVATKGGSDEIETEVACDESNEKESVSNEEQKDTPPQNDITTQNIGKEDNVEKETVASEEPKVAQMPNEIIPAADANLIAVEDNSTVAEENSLPAKEDATIPAEKS